LNKRGIFDSVREFRLITRRLNIPFQMYKYVNNATSDNINLGREGGKVKNTLLKVVVDHFKKDY